MTMASESTNIMVVDDTQANLKLLQEMLQAKGYQVLTFLCGATALKAAAKNPPDLILLDINMPEMNGFEVCERLKADEVLKDIPVIFISDLTAKPQTRSRHLQWAAWIILPNRSSSRRLTPEWRHICACEGSSLNCKHLMS